MVKYYGQVHGRNWGIEHQPLVKDGERRCSKCNFSKPMYMFYWEGEYHTTCKICKKQAERQRRILRS